MVGAAAQDQLLQDMISWWALMRSALLLLDGRSDIGDLENLCGFSAFCYLLTAKVLNRGIGIVEALQITKRYRRDLYDTIKSYT